MKRFLMVIAAVALAALVAVSLMRGTTSVSAATNTAQTQQNGPGDCGPGGPRQDDGTHAGGQVASLSGSTITVTGRDGTSQDIRPVHPRRWRDRYRRCLHRHRRPRQHHPAPGPPRPRRPAARPPVTHTSSP
ncbi:hypothetical protein EKD04_011040 [Chloroflexales bacterium ZM16-3]|nr:hypothetical protein [Chloroflexales bacterium ZM16-3]